MLQPHSPRLTGNWLVICRLWSPQQSIFNEWLMSTFLFLPSVLILSRREASCLWRLSHSVDQMKLRQRQGAVFIDKYGLSLHLPRSSMLCSSLGWMSGLLVLSSLTHKATRIKQAPVLLSMAWRVCVYVFMYSWERGGVVFYDEEDRTHKYYLCLIKTQLQRHLNWCVFS